MIVHRVQQRLEVAGDILEVFDGAELLRLSSCRVIRLKRIYNF
jgi:hypothetical protein